MRLGALLLGQDVGLLGLLLSLLVRLAHLGDRAADLDLAVRRVDLEGQGLTVVGAHAVEREDPLLGAVDDGDVRREELHEVAVARQDDVLVVRVQVDPAGHEVVALDAG